MTGLFVVITILTALITLTLIVEYYQLDIRCMALFFNADSGWVHGRAQPWDGLYRYGPIPGFILGAIGLAGLIASGKIQSLKGLQRHFLVIVLTLIIGPGLLVNVCCKDYWGRPRPEQTQIFGGQWEYRSVFFPGIPGRGKSFPSGHCSMGFLFISLMVFWNKSRMIAVIGGVGGMMYGALLGVARIATGGHYPTDVLWSCGIVAITVTVLYYWVLRIPDITHAPAGQAGIPGKGWKYLKFTSLVTVILLIFLCRKPFFSSSTQTIPLSGHINRLVIHSNVEFEKQYISFLDHAEPKIVINSRGFALPKAKHRITGEAQQSNQTLHLYRLAVRSGLHTNLRYSCTITLPLQYKKKLKIDMMSGKQVTPVAYQKGIPAYANTHY
jgi:membrane-associated PAP2 superfamily phosphatase